ncbi:hypothetical protein [Sulfurivirga sp.]|uniref:hypothetical protein n=1 Tax=Sulfurivirga sp. TaxID=2614236 RepID=UPI0025F4ED0D|nr:hypothetical protein [Sulfurivirga sp.]
MKFKREDLFWALLTLVLFVAGYIFLRLAYHVADQLPFSQEWVLIVLGTLVTITLTALLLNRQTETELKKEERAKFLELKTRIYFELLDHIQEVVIQGRTDETEAKRMRMLSHKLAIVASPEVLQQYQRFLTVYHHNLRNRELDAGETEQIMDELARLTLRIRTDILGEAAGDDTLGREETDRIILATNDIYDEQDMH